MIIGTGDMAFGAGNEINCYHCGMRLKWIHTDKGWRLIPRREGDHHPTTQTECRQTSIGQRPFPGHI